MLCKRIVKLTVFVLLLQFVGYLLFTQYRSSWSLFSKLSESVTTGHSDDAQEMYRYGLGAEKNEQSYQVNKVPSLQFSESAPAILINLTTVQIVNKISTTTKARGVANANKAESVTNSAIINVINDRLSGNINDRLSGNLLISGVTALLKAQLEINNTMTPFSVKDACVPKKTLQYACVNPNCTQLSNNMTARVQSLFSERTVLTKEQDDLLISIASQIPENDVIILSAVSSNHYNEMQAMLHSLHSTVFPELSKRENFSLVLWDLGLTWEQHKQTEKCCRCQVISFPFEKFPKRMRDLRCYMWKPLVIRMTQLRARKYAVWQDASIRYIRFPGPVFEKGIQHGLQLMRKKVGVSTSYRTLPETFAYLGQEVCNFYPYTEIASGFGVYKNDPFVLTAVTNPWARCGFEEACMCPKPSLASYRCHYGPCHRFDQSALTIITATLYSSEMYRILLFEPDLNKIFWVGRNNKEINYFNSTGCLS